MAFSIFGGGAKNNFIVLDVGNASVGGALVNNKNGIKILETDREEIPLGEHVRFERLLKNTTEAIGKISEKLAKKSGARISEVRVILASPWYASETKVVSVKKTKPFVFISAIQNEIVEKEIRDYKELLGKRNEPGYEKVLAVIENSIIHTRVNGYDTANAINKEVLEVKLALYIAVSHDGVLTAIRDRLRKCFPHAKISFNSFSLAYFSVIRDLYPDKRDFMMMDVSGEVTDVSLVRRGVLQESASFPLGRNFFLRRIASGLRKTLPEAESLISLFTHNALHAEEKEKFLSVFENIKNDWLKSFQNTLTDLSGELYVPGEIFLAADGSVESIFIDWISSEEFSQYALSHEKFNVMPISRYGICKKEGGDCASHDEFLNIGALFAQKMMIMR